MAFENLSERIQKALKNLTGKGKISEEDINSASREIRLALQIGRASCRERV